MTDKAGLCINHLLWLVNGTEMTDLYVAIQDWSKRAVRISAECTSEEATKQHLILPFFEILGFNTRDPSTFVPEYGGFSMGQVPTRMDYAVFVEGLPSIAVECKPLSVRLTDYRDQIASYFSAEPRLRLAILTNGIQFLFYTDTEETNILDHKPFVSVDLRQIAAQGLNQTELRTFNRLVENTDEFCSLRELASEQVLKGKITTWLGQELRSPSDEFCRFALAAIGEKYVRQPRINNCKRILKESFAEGLVQPLFDRVKQALSGKSRIIADAALNEDPRIVTTERELDAFHKAREQILVLTAAAGHRFDIDAVQFEDQVTKFTVFYKKKNKGRIFDFFETDDGYGRFAFPSGNVVDARAFQEAASGIAVAFEYAVTAVDGTKFR